MMPTSTGDFDFLHSLISKRRLLLLFFVISSTCAFHFKLFWTDTPSNLKTFALSMGSFPIERRGGSGTASGKDIHMSLVFFGINSHSIKVAQLFTSFIDCCKLLPEAPLTPWCCVQSSAYFSVLTFNISGRVSSKSSM